MNKPFVVPSFSGRIRATSSNHSSPAISPQSCNPINLDFSRQKHFCRKNGFQIRQRLKNCQTAVSMVPVRSLLSHLCVGSVASPAHSAAVSRSLSPSKVAYRQSPLKPRHLLNLKGLTGLMVPRECVTRQNSTDCGTTDKHK